MCSPAVSSRIRVLMLKMTCYVIYLPYFFDHKKHILKFQLNRTIHTALNKMSNLKKDIDAEAEAEVARRITLATQLLVVSEVLRHSPSPRYWHDFDQTWNNLTRTCHNLTQTCHNIIWTGHNVIHTYHNWTQNWHNLTKILMPRWIVLENKWRILITRWSLSKIRISHCKMPWRKANRILTKEFWSWKRQMRNLRSITTCLKRYEQWLENSG